MSIETLLSRLQKVKSTSRGRWMCSCPAHEDKSPSMHIQLLDDGKILINCKAGCDTYSILQSIGLDWSDVMPESPTHHRQRPQKQVLYPSEALTLIRHESMIVSLVAADIAKQKPVSTERLERLEKSIQTIIKCAHMAGI